MQKTESNVRPEKFSVTDVGAESVIFYAENITESQTEEGEARFTYDMYEYRVPYQAGLAARIAQAQDTWAAFIKANQPKYKPSASEQIADLESAVLELAEIIGG